MELKAAQGSVEHKGLTARADCSSVSSQNTTIYSHWEERERERHKERERGRGGNRQKDRQTK